MRGPFDVGTGSEGRVTVRRRKTKVTGIQLMTTVWKGTHGVSAKFELSRV